MNGGKRPIADVGAAGKLSLTVKKHRPPPAESASFCPAGDLVNWAKRQLH
jgi:hypothetical protein